jgi:hypothetical protein
MQERRRANDIADRSEFDDENVRRDPVIMRADIPCAIDAVNAELLVGFAGYVASKEPAVSFQRNHVGFQASLFEGFFDRVGRFIPLLAVNHLAKKTERDELCTDNDEQEPDKKQWSVAEGSSSEEPLDGKVAVDKHADHERNEAPHSEQVEGPADVPCCEENGQKIEKSAGETADTEFRVAVLSGTMLNDLLADAKASPVRKGGNITVKLAVNIDVLDYIFPVRLEAAIHVVDRYAGHHCRDGIRKPGRNRFGKRVVPSLFPAGDEIVFFLEHLDE